MGGGMLGGYFFGGGCIFVDFREGFGITGKIELMLLS